MLGLRSVRVYVVLLCAVGAACDRSPLAPVTDWPREAALARISIAPPRTSNSPPNAVNDAAITWNNFQQVIRPQGNDSDPDGDTLVVVAVTKPTSGTALVFHNHVIYTPATGYTGPDQLRYTVKDIQGNSSSATIDVMVHPTPADADLEVTAVASTYWSQGKQYARLFVTEQNIGPNPSENAYLTVDPVSGWLFKDRVGNGCAALTNGSVTCYRSPQPSATARQLQLTYEVSGPGTHQVTLRIAGANRDPVTSNNATTITVVVP